MACKALPAMAPLGSSQTLPSSPAPAALSFSLRLERAKLSPPGPVTNATSSEGLSPPTGVKKPRPCRLYHIVPLHLWASFALCP